MMDCRVKPGNDGKPQNDGQQQFGSNLRTPQ